METLKNIGVALAGAAVMFAAIAFTVWDVDVSQWEGHERGATVAMCAVCAFGALAIRNVKHLS
jgi:hypothetical protein